MATMLNISITLPSFFRFSSYRMSISMARPEFDTRPANRLPNDKDPDANSSANITVAAQFGINPINVANTGWNTELFKSTVLKKSCPANSIRNVKTKLVTNKKPYIFNERISALSGIGYCG